jgi:glutathione S-transferase
MDRQIYLHHYPASLFSEKIRALLGYLGLTWHSVEISSIMPRPLLMPLTGGYRKTPTLQIGANVFCDTAVITAALIRHTGDSTLYAPGFNAHRVAEWADSTLFRTTVALNFRPEALAASMSRLSEAEVAAFQADRAELSGGAPIVSVPPAAAENAFGAYLAQLEASLDADFLFGPEPSIADFAVYHCLWFVQQNAVNAALLEPYVRVGDWLARMAAFGHGEVVTASAEDALAHAREQEPVMPHVKSLALSGVTPGVAVDVTPCDYGRIPVRGRLLAASDLELIVERDHEQTGRVFTHFPNIGFEVSPV